MLKSYLSLSGFCTTQYRYHRVVLKCRKVNNCTIEIIHIHNLGNEGNGKIVMENLIKYAKELNYKLIKLEVFHYTDFAGISHLNLDLINYYKKLGFILGEIFSNNAYMEMNLID